MDEEKRGEVDTFPPVPMLFQRPVECTQVQLRWKISSGCFWRGHCKGCDEDHADSRHGWIMKGEEERKTESKGRGRMGKRTVPLHNIFTIKNFSVLFGQTFTAIRAIWLSNQIQTWVVMGLKGFLYLLIALQGQCQFLSCVLLDFIP